jgi:hypothetical protein
MPEWGVGWRRGEAITAAGARVERDGAALRALPSL